MIEEMPRKSVSVLDLSREDLSIFKAQQQRLRPGFVGRVTLTRMLIDKNDAAQMYAHADHFADTGVTVAAAAIADEAVYLAALQTQREKATETIDHKKNPA
jgi:hypothetical protein